MATRQLPVLPASGAGLDSDLYHLRQGATDKSLTGLLLKAFTKFTNQDFYTVSGIDVYTGTAVTETATPAAYFNGQKVAGVFNTNTGIASTINVAGLGIKSIKVNGADPAAGEIDSRTVLIFDLGNDWFEVLISNVYTEAEKTKLAGIETAATADQTNAEIKIAYEANANTNEFSDAEQTKLAGIETAATADQTNAEIKTAYEANANTNEFSDAEQTKLAGIETAATADQTAADIRALGFFDTTNDGAGSGLDADLLDGITSANFLRSNVADTVGGNLTWLDNIAAFFGTGADLKIFHDGSNSFIVDQGTGNLFIQSTSGDLFLRTSSSENAIFCDQNAGVHLYFNNVQKLSTDNDGVVIQGTGMVRVPDGTTAQRPTGLAGMIRYNTSLSTFEGFSTAWGNIGGGAKGGSGDQVFYENDQTVTTNYTITTGQNAMSAGPITVNNGITVTVPSGSEWTIV
jgi:hypothetical protein